MNGEVDKYTLYICINNFIVFISRETLEGRGDATSEDSTDISEDASTSSATLQTTSPIPEDPPLQHSTCHHSGATLDLLWSNMESQVHSSRVDHVSPQKHAPQHIPVRDPLRFPLQVISSILQQIN